jgi:hypothetical protein
MRAQPFTAVVLALLASAAVARLAAQQSLADLARQEEERRKKTPPPTKVYTNKDLGPGGAAPAAPVAAPAAEKDAKDAKDAKEKDAGDVKGAKDGKDAADQDKSKPKDQAYWAGRVKALNEALDRDTSYSIALQTRINSLTTDFVNRDDPAQRAIIERDRVKALAELDRLKKAIVDDKKAIADLEEEARRAGVPAGWIR